ncbi:hypothetical protein [Candidatus Campylobacter infans]|uniref:hypothetical protein n=1 Tax=Candidatus Campylobacter infans TaxID=2561898 RepID=UPI0015D1C395|nr:hypothetical protein [Candidatus Campylobacter infans]
MLLATRATPLFKKNPHSQRPKPLHLLISPHAQKPAYPHNSATPLIHTLPKCDPQPQNTMKFRKFKEFREFQNAKSQNFKDFIKFRDFIKQKTLKFIKHLPNFKEIY